ncbi:MAG TPA: M28 family peptidase [Acidimicrobiales bacterium]|nr:M28 family peptidase [Acidimicrobiales bacterium]
MRMRRAAAAALGMLLVAAGCASPRHDVGVLASDALGGRDNGTPGSVLAQDYLTHRLRGITRDVRKVPIAGGTNLIGVIPGRDLADEVVVVGAHYDHLGSRCRTADPADTICNGATDNATGVAAALAVGEDLARGRGPRRTVVIGLWDREEDGLLGSAAYVAHPSLPLDRTVAYVNFDIQGANVAPSLRSTTFALAAETGGEGLQAAVTRAAAGGPLHTEQLSTIFGQGRSDHVNFLGAGVPSVFFSDSTGPCYHTAQDEAGIVDQHKLGAEIRTARRLSRDLANRDQVPGFVAGTPLVDYQDAVVLDRVGDRLLADLGRFTPAQQTTLLAFRTDIKAIVAAGPAAFTPDAGTRLLVGVLGVQDLLTQGACDGFLGH